MAILDLLRGGSPRDQFAKKVMASARRAGWSGPLDYDPGRFSIRCSDDATVFLENIYAEWTRADKATREAMMQHYGGLPFNVTAELPKTWSEAAGDVLPVVRNIGYVLNPALDPEPREEGGESPYRILTGSLGAFVALDGPTGISILSQKALDDWSVTFDEALEVALENLRAVSSCTFVKEDGGFRVSDYGDFYDASRVLLPEVFASLNLWGDPVVIVVSRAGLLVAGSDDGPALEAMAQFAEDVMATETRPISRAAIVYRDGEWRPFAPGPEQAKLRELQLQQDLWAYAEQAEELDAHFERTGRDIDVATLSGQVVDGRFSSWASWAWNAESLLPMADVFILSNEAGETIARCRTDIERLVAFEIEPGIYPQRYIVRSMVDRATWEAIRNLPVPSDYSDTVPTASLS